MFMHSLSGVTGGLPVSVFYVVDFDVLAADFTSSINYDSGNIGNRSLSIRCAFA